MRVAIYTRLSPNPDKDDTINQERELREFASRNGWVIVSHYSDIHISGGKRGKDRPQFSKMFQDASRRKFDMVLFWSLDRLSREGAFATLQYLNQLSNWGVNFKSYTEQYLDSCGIFKDAVISILGVVAKQERIRLIERTMAGLQTARAKGKILGRPRRKINIAEARRMREQGETLKAIGAKYGASEATLSRLLKGVSVNAATVT